MTPPYWTVKAPVFSFEKLGLVDISLGPEMKSTGEVLGMDEDCAGALYKAITASMKCRWKGDLVSIATGIKKSPYRF